MTLEEIQNRRGASNYLLVKNTKFVNKLYKYLETLKRTDWFMSAIDEAREKCHIPKDGLKGRVNNRREYEKIAKKLRILTDDQPNSLFAHIKQKSGLDIFGEAFEFFLIFGDLENFKKVGSLDYAYCIDALFFLKSELLVEYVLMDMAKLNPIAIMINPYMSQRDIIDYVKKAYLKGIKPIQERYENKFINIGRVRIKSEEITRRDNFIWKHKNRPKREIALLLRENGFEVIDVGLIGKILSLREKEEAKRTSLNS